MRIFAAAIIVLLIIFAPFYIYLPAIFLAIIYFPFFVEGIVLAFLVDVLYGLGGHSGIFFGFPFGLLAGILVLISIIVREQLRLNA